VTGHAFWGSGRVVGDEPDPHASCASSAEGVGRARHRQRPDVDNPVEIEQPHVVQLAQWTVRGLEHRISVGAAPRRRS
jgi:hypothetical protein